MKIRSIAVAALCVALVSCMGTKKLTILTQPTGADVSVNGVMLKGKTPLTIEVSQKKDLGIVASKPGYETAAHTVKTRSNWWLALLWTKNDPRAQYIEEDEVMISLKKIPAAEGYRATTIPPYTGGSGRMAPASKVPELRPMPSNLMR